MQRGRSKKTNEQLVRLRGVAMLVALALVASAVLPETLAYAMDEETPYLVSAESESPCEVASCVQSAEEVEGLAGDPATESDMGSIPVTEPAAVVAEELEAPGDEPRQEEALEQAEDADPVTAQVSIPEAPEGATEVEEDTYVIQAAVASDRVLDAAGKSPSAGANVSSWSYGGGSNQTWEVVREGESSWYRLFLEGSQRSLCMGTQDLGNGHANVCVLTAQDESQDAGALLSVLWSFVDAGSGSYRLVNAAWADQCLDVYGGTAKIGSNVGTWAVNASAPANQRFSLVKRHPDVQPGSAQLAGAYNLQLAGTELIADVAGAKAANGTNVALWRNNNGRHQRIALERDDEGYYIAWIVGTGKVLDVAKGSILPGTNVLQWTYSGGDNQRWAIEEMPAGDGGIVVTLRNKATGLYLGATSATAGGNLAGVSDSSDRRCFALLPTELLDAGICLIRPRSTGTVVLDVAGAQTGEAALTLWTSTGALNQRFELVKTDTRGVWRIRTGSSGGWITWIGGDSVRQVGSSATAASDANGWRAVWSSGGVSLINIGSELVGDPRALCMDGTSPVKGTRIVASAPTGGSAQSFVFEQADLLKPGYYFVQNGGGKYLAVKGTSAKNGANIQVGKFTGGMGQLFQLVKSGNRFKIKNIYSNRYLQATKAASGANVSQKASSASALQLWIPAIADGGKIAFASAADASLVLEAAGNGSSEGANVRLALRSGSAKGSRWNTVSLSSLVTTAKSARQKKVVKAAKKTPSPGYGLCAAWVTNVLKRAGIGTWGGDACDQYRLYCKSSDLTKLRPGMIVAVSSHGHTAAGKIWGHVAVYVGNGKVMDNVGKIRTMSLYDWLAWYGDRVTPKWGWLGNRKLS